MRLMDVYRLKGKLPNDVRQALLLAALVIAGTQLGAAQRLLRDLRTGVTRGACYPYASGRSCIASDILSSGHAHLSGRCT